MDGLEAVELKLSEVLEDNDSFRIDSEYFKKEYLEIENLIHQHKLIKLENISEWITQGPNPKFSKTGTHCLTGRNVKTGHVTYDNSDYIDEKELESLKKFLIKIDDILITLKGKGSIGKLGFVRENKRSIFSRDIGLIRIESKKINVIFVYIFLISRFGKKLIEKGETGGTGQSTLTTSYLKNMDIPVLSKNFQAQIEGIVKSSYEKLDQSKALYKQAEELLLKELDLLDFEPSKEKVAIKNLSESFGSIGRLDSEYYLPKYDEILGKIKSYGSGKLSSVCNVKDENFNPENEILYNYIELSDIGTEGEITGYTNEVGKNLPSRARRKISLNDVIVSSVEGSLDKVALVNLSEDNLLCSTGFYVIN